CCHFFFQAEDGIRDRTVTGVQTCALPILRRPRFSPDRLRPGCPPVCSARYSWTMGYGRNLWSIPPTGNSTNSAIRLPSSLTLMRSEEHTSELQSPYDLVCRLLLEKKNKS